MVYSGWIAYFEHTISIAYKILFLRTIFQFFLVLGSFFANLAEASETYSFAQINEERLALELATAEDKQKAVELIEERISNARHDPIRRASLFIQKAKTLQHTGLALIEENLAEAMPLFDDDEYPELYLRAMSVKAYGMYTYQDQVKDAALLLETLQNHPAVSRDPHTQLTILSNLIEVYYHLKEFEKIPGPLFTLSKLSRDYVTPETAHLFNEIDEELLYHSGRIGDIPEAVQISEKLIQQSNGQGWRRNLATIYCNLANLHFMPFPEKVRYARASLAADPDTSCSDVMEKLVLLDEVQQGKLDNINRLSKSNPSQKMPGLNDLSTYYAGLAYLELNDTDAASALVSQMPEKSSWRYFDLQRKINEKKGDFRAALDASTRYQNLREQLYEDARILMLSSYKVRLKIAQEETASAERDRQAERLASAEQKTESQQQLIITMMVSGLVVAVLLGLYLYRSHKLRLTLQHLSDTDALTGLLNRRAFLRHVEQLKLLAHRQNFTISIVLIDLDLFKQVNDQYGHHIGDSVLASFADAAKASLRQTDVVGRFGGEEFILATTEHGLEQIAALLERLLDNFNLRCNQGYSLGFEVSFSAGVSTMVGGDSAISQDISQAIKEADELLYQAKANGRKQVCTKQGCLRLGAAA